MPDPSRGRALIRRSQGYRRQWEALGTLWSAGQQDRLAEHIRDDLADLLGLPGCDAEAAEAMGVSDGRLRRMVEELGA